MLRFVWVLPTFFSVSAFADNSVWQDIGQVNKTAHVAQARAGTSGEVAALESYRALTLDAEGLHSSLNVLASLGLDASAGRNAGTISLPLPDGSFTHVTITPTEILAPEIAAEHPEIQTWDITGTDDKVVGGTIDFTALGFHAMLELRDGDTVFIDPVQVNGEQQYASFSKKVNYRAFSKSWDCGASGAHFQPNATAARTAAKAGETLNTYRIAIATTAEFTTAKGGQSAAYSSIVSTLNRVNQIYKRDLSIALTLVSNTNTVFTNTSSDGYTHGTPSAIIDENSTVLNNVGITSGTYDIGHVFDTSGGGLAYVGVVCGTSKAGGMTGLNASGDTFDIDYVAHEIGHQFGASHTFNSSTGSCSGNREVSTAYEPGSGSTIMSYSGICGSDNLQTNSDAMFHAASIAQIIAYAHNGAGASCATKTALSNTNPVVNAGADYVIPARTPFILTGSATDANSNTLSYSWEEVDTGTTSSVGVDMGNNAIIRAYPPSSSAERIVPRMSDLVAGTQAVGESLPSTSRVLNFRLQVRDGDTATGRGTAYDDMKITVSNTGSAFAITAPTSTSFTPNALQTVTWNVAGTDQSPINCSAVDIALTTDSGTSFTTLASGVANTGSATVTLPATLGATNRIRVKCSNNIFFALSATNPSVASAGTSSGGSTSSTVSTTGGGGGGALSASILALLGLAGVVRGLRKRKLG